MTEPVVKPKSTTSSGPKPVRPPAFQKPSFGSFGKKQKFPLPTLPRGVR